jgi:hypothetical protein
MQRAFSCSLDKTFKVYDIPSKTIIKVIQVQSPILKLEVDHCEQFVYLACDNLNVYQHALQNTGHDRSSSEQMSQVTSAIASNSAVQTIG